MILAGTHTPQPPDNHSIFIDRRLAVVVVVWEKGAYPENSRMPRIVPGPRPVYVFASLSVLRYQFIMTSLV